MTEKNLNDYKIASTISKINILRLSSIFAIERGLPQASNMRPKK